MIRSFSLAAAAALALACAACSSTGPAPSAQGVAQTVVQNQATERAGVEQAFTATASGITVATQTGVLDPTKLSSLRADLTLAYASLQISRTVFVASGAAGSAALTAAQTSADQAYASADKALSAAGG